MSTRHRDRWAAFLLSLVVPGAGQLWAGRWSCLAYFAAASGVVAAVPSPSGVGALIRWAALGLLGLGSAEHARRCVERGPRRRDEVAVPVRSRVFDRSGRGRRIDLTIEVDVGRPVAEIWDRMADFARFVTIDPFHSRVIVLGPDVRPGVALVLEHQAFGLDHLRFGRLLTWREGSGYSFSDLSGPRGNRGFFPHVFDFAVTPDGAAASRLTVRVRGRWTSRGGSARLGRWWFGLVCREHARLLRSSLSRSRTPDDVN